MRPLLYLTIAASCANAFLAPAPEAMTRNRLLASVENVSSPLADVLRKPRTKSLILEVLENEFVESRSTTLRKIGVTALATSDKATYEALVKEQETARGNFPGPCPVLFVQGSNISIGDSVALAVVTSVEEAKSPPAIVVDSDLPNALELVEAAQEKAIVVWRTNSMQPKNSELEVPTGVTTVWLKGAVVGDSEDIEYAQFAVDGLTKKRSKSFQMTGLTGSTNGHFGGVARKTAVSWLRKQKA